MGSPARGVRFIHHALRREATSFADAIADAPPAALHAQLVFLARIARVHNEGEERGMFADLDERAPGAADVYLREHREEDVFFDAIAGECAALLDDPTRGRARLRALAGELRDHLHEHIRREDDEAIPAIERLFTAAEQTAQIGRMMSAFAPSDLAAVMPWVVMSLEPAGRIEYVGELAAATPPERMALIATLFAEALPAAVWRAITDAVPGLAAL